MPSRRKSVCVLALSVIAACKAEPSTAPAEQSQDIWRDAPEASKVSISAGGGNGTLKRCWQLQGSWDCLAITKVGATYMANRYRRADLVSVGPSEVFEGDGYSCDFDPSGNFEERVTRGTSTVASNAVALTGPTFGLNPWAPGYATNFMRENSIDPALPEFNCAALAFALRSTSLQAAGTTTVAYAAVMQ